MLDAIEIPLRQICHMPFAVEYRCKYIIKRQRYIVFNMNYSMVCGFRLQDCMPDPLHTTLGESLPLEEYRADHLRICSTMYSARGSSFGEQQICSPDVFVFR